MHHEPPQSFEEFWPYYVSQHLNPVSRALHVVGTSIGLAHLPAVAVFPPAIVPALAWGYGLAWVGHFAFEKNRPASWNSAQHLAWSFRGDMRMVRYTLTGRMKGEVDRVRDQLAAEEIEAAAPGAASSPTVHA
jgi:hypothetical protein